MKMSRRKFMATSPAVAVGILALGGNPSRKGFAQEQGDAVNPNEIIASIDQIAPFGVVQDRVEDELQDELAQHCLSVARAEYDALAGEKSLAQARSLTTTRYKEIDQRITNIRTSMIEDGLRFTNYTLDAQIDGVWAERQTASIIWTEKVVLNLAGDPDPNAPQISFETKTHLTSLRKDGADWYIENDDENFGMQPLVFDAYNMPNSITDEPASTKRSYKVYLPFVQNFNAGKALIRPTEELSNSEERITRASYSREQAADYAARYGQSGGMDGYHDFGNNCTNFISRCLQHGGWPDKFGWYKSTESWWYHGQWPTYSSYPWHNCHYWYWFTYNNNRGTRIYNIWDLWFGDILLYDFNKNGYCDHAAICHYRSWRGPIYMAQHTYHYAWKPLSQIVAGQDWRYYPWRMNTSF